MEERDKTMSECTHNCETCHAKCSERQGEMPPSRLDKIKRKSEIEANLLQIRQVLSLPEEVLVIPFSAEKGTGRDELVRIILNAVKAK